MGSGQPHKIAMDLDPGADEKDPSHGGEGRDAVHNVRCMQRSRRSVYCLCGSTQKKEEKKRETLALPHGAGAS